MYAGELVVALLIVILSIIKPLAYRPVAQHYDLSFSALFTSMWTTLFIALSFPFLGKSFIAEIPLLLSAPQLILFGVSKGIVAWYSIKFSQAVNKQSTSSVVFFPFISLALASFTLNMFLGESLNLLQLAIIFLLGVLGFILWFFGMVKELSKDWKKYFIFAIVLSALCPVLDHVALRQMNWYSYFVLSNLTTLVICLCRRPKLLDFKRVFISRDVFVAGFFNTLREIVVISASVSILPVSLVNFSIRLAAPIVMVFSAIRYKESTVKSQLIFGIVALLLALPIIMAR